MSSISLNTAASITGLTKRTLWRHIEKGSLSVVTAQTPGDQTRVYVSQVLPLSRLALGPEDDALIVAADQGDCEAQCDLGLLLLNANRPLNAVYWLNLAAKQQSPNAMCYLGRCYLACEGIPPDQKAGLMWIGQAAANGHLVAQALMLFLQGPKGQQLLERHEPNALDAALDAVERQVMLKVLGETADPIAAGR